MTVPQDSTWCKRRFWPCALATLVPGAASAHSSEQGFVLLLPTDVYIAAGAAAVAVTVLVLALVPARLVVRLLRPVRLVRWRRGRARHRASLGALAVLAALLWAGFYGPRDPLANPLPLTVWTMWWIGLVALSGVVGNLWVWLNPWTGALALLRRAFGLGVVLRVPHRLAPWLGVAGLVAFCAFLLADPAPADPARLARVVLIYWVVVLIAGLVCGPRFVHRAEPFGILFACYGRLAIPGRSGGYLAVGLPGWQLARMRRPLPGLAVFMVCLLASGSFDGLNETFRWLALLGINPLEFPGRSAVIAPTLAGLLAANLALLAAFWLCIRSGMMLAGERGAGGFCRFAPAILPIAFGYHVGHYLTAFLVDAQYVLVAASDPLASGADLLGLGQFYVTTGFFNTRDTVRTIWLAQAGAVVGGHLVSVLLAHAIALRVFGDTRRAVLSQVPLAGFMVAYTVFGLWLLAAPRGG